jgi:aryl-alcohol dehydrogenase-like predicted oxidoreductase
VHVEARAFGATGIDVMPLGLGAGALGDERISDRDADALLDAAANLGVTLIDTARSYGVSEERIGRWLGARRERVVLSTKGGYGVAGVEDWTALAIERGIDDALARLRTDRIDVFHLHSCPLETLQREDILEALDRAKASGKIRVAAYSGENEALAWAASSARFGSVQCSVNVFDQASLARTLPSALRDGIGVLAKRSLANAPWRFATQPHGEYAETYWTRMRAMQFDPSPLTWHEVALRFSAFAPGVSAILIGTSSASHLEANVRLLERGPLPPAVLDALHASFDAHGEGWRGEV